MENNDHIRTVMHPDRFPGMSMKMRAILGFLFERKYTQPSFVKLIVTSDGILMGMVEGDIGFNDFIGSVDEFRDNWNRLIHIPEIGLTREEVKYLEELPSVCIRNYHD